ncbi:ATP-binding protein [Labedella populi]|uniref:ATP-binding protein n=1 Tax=Labedella populi TaxID=2498850 RepID=A0A3S3ZKL8_9MICO|nr:ATP-binding protein [Labedella populi]
MDPRGPRSADVFQRSEAVVLIDGPSGAGKSTFASRLVGDWPGPVEPILVRMDDVYPGWGGLDAASVQVFRHLLVPRSHGEPGRWRRYDWVGARPAEWHVVATGRPLVVEGCGSLSRAAAPLADLRVWIDAPAEVRKDRALARDAGGFDEHWDMWSSQVARFERREDPRSLADVVIVNADGEADAWLDAVISGTADPRRRP